MDLMTYLLATQNGGGGGSDLPEVTSADNGKVLKVKDGVWDKGDDVSGDNLPPVSSSDNGKVLKVIDAEWNIGTDEDGVEAVELTQDQYDELSTAEKEDPTKVYFINTDTPTLDPRYAYHTNQDETLIYRCKAIDGSEGMWFLNGFEVTSLTNTAIPTELRQYAPTGNGKVSDAWADTNGTPFLVGGKQCYAGIYQNTVRIWSNNGTTNQLGTIYAVIDMRLDNRQYNEWSDPYIYITDKNRKIYYKDVKYSVSIPDSTVYNNGKILRIINGTWSIDDETVELPSVSSSDNGKILKVADGQWAKGDAPSGLPATTTSDAGKILKVNSTGDWDKGEEQPYIALTQAQYDALPSSKLTDGKMYCITDQDGNVVTQSPTITNADYEILFSGTADNTEHTEVVRKSNGFLYNPSKKSITIGSRQSSTTIGSNSFEFGNSVSASGPCSYAEGNNTTASGDYSHAEGGSNTASGDYSHAEGGATTASGLTSHAEGSQATASGDVSHAEGNITIASGDYSHAEGFKTTASGITAHAEGSLAVASGNISHAEGLHTIAQRKSQHVFGAYNILDTTGADGSVNGNYIEIVGNGTADNARSNARTLDWSGNEWIAGTYTNGSSRKIKTNIESLTNTEALKILDLNPVKFDFIKTGTYDQRERGFIAEEVMNVIPQIAFEEETDNEGNITKPASLNYIGLIPYLVKMIQIQQQEIDELKEQINN